jgi:predicted CopG family antitoxin
MTKTLTIRDEVYKKLLNVKRRDESFSKLFERLVSDRGCVEFEDKEKMLAEIQAQRTERRPR